MKTFPALALSALTLLGALAPLATDAQAGHRHRGRNIGLGILGTAAAVAIIAGSSRRSHADDGYYSSAASRCDRWAYRCDRGSDWACEKYERYCE